MSWWDSAGFTNLATQALKTAQQRIDKVLDIQDEAHGAASTGVSSASSAASPSTRKPGNTGDEFWNNWLETDTGQEDNPPGTSAFLSDKTKTTVKKQREVSKVTSVKESSKTVSTIKESTTEFQSISGKVASAGDEIISVTKPKISQSDYFESVSLTATVNDSLDTFSDPPTAFSPIKTASENVGSKSVEKKRSPLKLGGRSKSKEKVESPSTTSQESAEAAKSSSSVVEEILKREKEAEETMIQLLGDNKEKVVIDTPSIKETSGHIENSKDLLKPIGNNAPVGNVDPMTDIKMSEVDTQKTDVLKADITESECKEQQDSDSKVQDQPAISDKLGVMVNADAMESSTFNWDDAGLLTDSQIVTDDLKSVNTEVTDDLKSANTEVTDLNLQDRAENEPVDSGLSKVDNETQLVIQDAADETKDEPLPTVELPVISSETDTPDRNILEQNPEIVPENPPETQELGDAADGLSMVSTLDESLTSETVDDLSSSNQTITAEDLQSVTTSRTSEADIDMCESKDSEESSKSDTVQAEEDPVQEPGVIVSEGGSDREGGDTEAGEVSDLPTVHQVRDGETHKDQPEHSSEGGHTVATGHPSHPDPPAASMTASHSSQCSSASSSFVKNMLEEAMVESVKDIDSRSDSHSSSDMVRVGSSQNSGHTSADELETATSSDIEIISHISTPTPNGENRGFSVDRPFDLSPLRHALNKAVRRNSPPGHHRTDSGSSAYSLQSRNGEEVTSPGDQGRYSSETDQHQSQRGQDRRSEEAANSDPLEKEKLLKENPALLSSLQTIAEGSESSQESLHHQHQNIDPSKVLEKLAEMAEILEARERKLVDLSRSNMDLMESNTILKNQLQQSEEAREAEMTDLNQLTDEFTKRISDTEKRCSQAAKERDTLKKSLQETEMILAQRSDSASTVERLLREKDLQISELMEEGQKLSKQQLQSNNLMKKLRSKEKESEKLIKSQEKKIESQTQELERLQKVLDNKCDVEKKHAESINQLQSMVKNQEKELEKYKLESEEAQDKLRSVQAALDNSYREIAELHKATVRRASEVQERALSAELQSKQALQKEMERLKVQTRQEQEALVNQIEDLQLSMSRMEKEQGRREDVLRQEISDLHQRLQEGEDRNQDLTDSVTAATRPLLRQIENLQSTYTAQSSSYEKVEKNLTDRLTEAHHQLATAQEKERVASEQLLDTSARVAGYESQLSTLRQDRSRLQAQLEMEKTRVQVLEDTNSKESAQREALQHSLESRLSELKKEKLLLENQLEMEKLKVESEKKKLLLAHEQLRDKELQLSQVKSRPTTPSDHHLHHPLKESVDANMLGSLASMSASSMSASFLSQGDEMERSFSVQSPKASGVNLYESMRSSGAASLMENLQSQLKQKDGEIVQLQNEIHELEHTRESMARELVNLTNEKHDLEDKANELPDALRKYKELDQRYNAILQMYGEKEEEVQELRLDLQDVKELYKTQIQELLRKS